MQLFGSGKSQRPPKQRWGTIHSPPSERLVSLDLYLLDSPAGAIHSRGKAELHLYLCPPICVLTRTMFAQGTTLRVVAQVELRAGDEVTIEYMPPYAQPGHFLRQYGFVPVNGTVDSGAGNVPHTGGVETCTNGEILVERQSQTVPMETEAETTLLLEGAALARQRKEFWRQCQCVNMTSKTDC